MIGALDLGADEGIDLIVGAHLRARLKLAAPIPVEGRLRKNLPGQSYARPHFDPIVRVTQVIEQDARLVLRAG